MKVLEKAGIVTVTKDKYGIIINLTESFADQFMGSMMQLFSDKDDCICNKLNCNVKGEKK